MCSGQVSCAKAGSGRCGTVGEVCSGGDSVGTGVAGVARKFCYGPVLLLSVRQARSGLVQQVSEWSGEAGKAGNVRRAEDMVWQAC